MDPIAFEAGSLTVRWYGIFAAGGFFAAFLLLMHRARRSAFIQKEQAADLAFFGVIGAILGSRLLYVIENWSHFQDNLFQIIRIDQGGLVFYGGFAGAAAVIILTCRYRNHSIANVADLFAPVIALGHGIGRIGCFINGCCFGQPWDGFLSVSYPYQHYSHIAGTQAQNGIIDPIVPVVPVQLIASGGNFAICLLILLLEKFRTPAKGTLFLTYVVTYAAVRFSTEFMRGDYITRPGGLTTAQWWCIPAVLGGAAIWVWIYYRRNPGAQQQS